MHAWSSMHMQLKPKLGKTTSFVWISLITILNASSIIVHKRNYSLNKPSSNTTCWAKFIYFFIYLFIYELTISIVIFNLSLKNIMTRTTKPIHKSHLRTEMFMGEIPNKFITIKSITIFSQVYSNLRSWWTTIICKL